MFFMEHGVPVKWFKPSFFQRSGVEIFFSKAPALSVLSKRGDNSGNFDEWKPARREVGVLSIRTRGSSLAATTYPSKAKEISGDSLGQIIGELGEGF